MVQAVEKAPCQGCPARDPLGGERAGLHDQGQALDARNVTGWFKKLLDTAGLPDMRWHDLRHSCASLLLAQRVDSRVAMEVLGHSQISQTMRYSHVIPELQFAAAPSMEQVLTGTMPN